MSVDDGEDELCLIHRSARARDAHALYLIVGLTYAGCVGQTKQYAAETQLLFDRVARRAGDIGDYGAVIAQNGVQKRAFSGVGPPDYRSRNARVQKLSAVIACAQALKHCRAAVYIRLVSRKGEVLDILVGIVEHRVIVRAYVGERTVYFVDAARYRSAELTGCVARGLGGFGIDDIRDCLRAGKIHATVKKCALCELAGQSLPRAEAEHRLKHRAQNDGRAVALKFGGVLAGVAVRSAAYRAKADIQKPPLLVAELSVDELSVLAVGHFAPRHRRKEPVCDFDRLASGHTDDAYRADLSAGGNGGYRV